MTRDLRIHAILIIAIFVASDSYGQNQQKNRLDEKRENERVQKAEKDVSEARRELSDSQKRLKEKLRAVESSIDAVRKAGLANSQLETEIEKELGVSLGIPDALAKVAERRKKLMDASLPVLEQLRSTTEWKTVFQEAETAKQKMETLEEDAELEDSLRDARLQELRKITALPEQLESEAIGDSSSCQPLQAELSSAIRELEDLRRKVSRERVESDPRFKKSLTQLEKARKEMAKEKNELVELRKKVSRAMQRVTEAQAGLSKARAADAMDPNINKGKNTKDNKDKDNKDKDIKDKDKGNNKGK